MSKDPFDLGLSCVDTFLAVHMYLQPDMIPPALNSLVLAPPSELTTTTTTYLPLMGGPLWTSLVACGMIADTRQGKNDEKEIEGGDEGGGDDADPNWKKRAREET